MISPWDGMVVGDKSDPIEFFGYHLDPGAVVELEVYNPATGSFDAIALGIADADTVAGSGETLWGWFEMGIVIPEANWIDNDSCEGAYARLRATDTGTGLGLLSVRDDWYSCYGDVDGDVGAYVARCTSDRGGEAWVQTEDFVEFAPSLAPWLEGLIKASRNSAKFQLRPEVPKSKYQRLQMRVDVDGIRETAECDYVPCLGAWRCDVDAKTSAFAGHFDDNDELSTALYERGRVEFRGLDKLSCSNGSTWTAWAAANGFYGSGNGVCSEPPDPTPPPPPPTFTTWELQCLCETAYGVGLIEMDACMANEVGSAWICDVAKRDFEAVYHTPIECVLTGYSGTGVTGCVDGEAEITDVEIELYE